MMAKPLKALELHYPMIQFLIIKNISTSSQGHNQGNGKTSSYFVSSQSYNKVQIKDDDDDHDDDDDEKEEKVWKSKQFQYPPSTYMYISQCFCAYFTSVKDGSFQSLIYSGFPFNYRIS